MGKVAHRQNKVFNCDKIGLMSWSQKRQLVYASIVLFFVLVVVGTPTYYTFFNIRATCTDGAQNQNEIGVDCGGPCARACPAQVVDLPVTTWSRAFPVAGGIYNLVAYVQNPNVNYVAQPSQYIFRVYDGDNVLIGVRKGFADVPPTKTFPIFEQGFDVGSRVPAKVFFEFIRGLTWIRYDGTKPELDVTDESLSNASSSPRIDAILVNKTIYTYKKVEVVALVYDDQGNAMASSRTFVDTLPGTGNAPLVFTWPTAFPAPVSKIEIVPKLSVSTLQ